ncbi:uncharacterized protein LOC144597566 [Rhinoraja longicauda]
MEDVVLDVQHILNRADSMEDEQQDALPTETSSALKEEGSNDIWSDFASYCKTPHLQQQGVGSFCGLPTKEKDDSIKRSSPQQGFKVLNGSLKSHYHILAQLHKSDERDSESKLAESVTSAGKQPGTASQLDTSGYVEKNNPGQSADSAVTWTAPVCHDQSMDGTLQTDRETECSDFGAGAILFSATTSLLQIQEILAANSALTTDSWNLVENIFQKSFPSGPVKHDLEDFPVMEHSLEKHGEESDPNKEMALSSYEFANAWGELHDLNKVALRFSWNVSSTRVKLLSTLGIDQNHKDDGRADLEDALTCSDLEKTGVLPGVATLSDHGPKALIQTRISIMPSQRAAHGLSQRLEKVFVRWMQMNGSRAQKTQRINRPLSFM